MWRCAIRSDTGVALLAAILALGLISAMALSMAMIASTEPAIAAYGEGAAAAGYLADAAMVVVAVELQAIPDWSAALGGTVRSSVLGDASSTVRLPDGRVLDLTVETNRLNCGRASGCTDGQMDMATDTRPWGRNNPRWCLYGHAWLPDLQPGHAGLPPFHIVAWVGDDPAERDDDPTVDEPPEGDPRPFGGRIIRVRTASFGPRGASAARTGSMLRRPDAAGVRMASRSARR